MQARNRKAKRSPTHGYGTPTAPGHWYEIKTIKGHPYLYKCWREFGIKHSQYLGKAIKHI